MVSIIQIINEHNILNVNYDLIAPDTFFSKINNIKKEKNHELIKLSYEDNFELTQIDFKYDEYLELRYIIEKEKIKLFPLNFISVHLIRLIGIKIIPNYNLELFIEINFENLKDILEEINLILQKNNSTKITDYCTICGEILNIKGLGKIIHCDKSNCISHSKTKVLDNRIINIFNKDPNVYEFLINALISGTTHPKPQIYNPLPILPGITTLSELKIKIDEEKNKGSFDIEHIKKSKTDIELYIKIGSISYGIINNAISDNYFSMNTIEKFLTEFTEISRTKLYNNNIFDSEEIKFIGFNYSYEIESRFKKEHFLFHGTPLYSWYPIIKNGLKVMSGTEFQANGAIHGKGIYFSDSFQFSLGYSRTIGTELSRVVGVFEINDDIEKYKKTTNIYVIGDDKIMLLRYLIIIKTDNLSKDYNQISNYFFKYLGGINKYNEKKSINIKNKRLTAEMKLLNSNKNIHHVTILDELKHWIIELNDIKENKIKLIIYFNEYPKLPPKIIINSTLNNIKLPENLDIIFEELNPSKWDVTLNLSIFVDKICTYISNSI